MRVWITGVLVAVAWVGCGPVDRGGQAAAIGWKQANRTLVYDVTTTTYATPSNLSRTMTVAQQGAAVSVKQDTGEPNLEFAHSGTMLASPTATNSLVETVPYLAIPQSAGVSVGDEMTQVQGPQDPQKVTLAATRTWKITSVTATDIRYEMRVSVRLENNAALAAVRDKLTSPSHTAQDFDRDLGAWLQGGPVAMCNGIYSRTREAVAQISCATVFLPDAAIQTHDDLMQSPSRQDVVLSLQ